MEGSAITLSGQAGAIVRGNEVHHFFNGIYAGRWGTAFLENPEIAFDADVYDNEIHHMGDDGLEPEGACINQRFRRNRMDEVLVGISLAPITHGPVWVVRNTISHFGGTSFKWGIEGYGPDGVVYVYHNTTWTGAVQQNAMTIYDRADNWRLRNNIFRGTWYAFEGYAVTGSTGHDWDRDNWYTTRAADEPHFKWEGVRYDDLAALCAATGLECGGLGHAPGLVDPEGGNLRLAAGSANVDAGVGIAGINDEYVGAGPDLGAYEFGGGGEWRVFLPVVARQGEG
jgi:hypothetical protein